MSRFSMYLIRNLKTDDAIEKKHIGGDITISIILHSLYKDDNVFSNFLIRMKKRKKKKENQSLIVGNFSISHNPFLVVITILTLQIKFCNLL